MTTFLMILAVALGVLPFVASAQSVDVGGGLAERWCLGCHVVETGLGDVASDGVPTFLAIVAKRSTTAESLNRYLSTAHTAMPDFSLNLLRSSDPGDSASAAISRTSGYSSCSTCNG
jgi:mono/diheme cytochrome c family protein